MPARRSASSLAASSGAVPPDHSMVIPGYALVKPSTILRRMMSPPGPSTTTVPSWRAAASVWSHSACTPDEAEAAAADAAGWDAGAAAGAAGAAPLGALGRAAPDEAGWTPGPHA